MNQPGAGPGPANPLGHHGNEPILMGWIGDEKGHAQAVVAQGAKSKDDIVIGELGKEFFAGLGKGLTVLIRQVKRQADFERIGVHGKPRVFHNMAIGR